METRVPTDPRAMLAHYIRPYRGRVALLTLLLLVSIGLQLVAPQLLGRFIDQAAGSAAARALTLTALLFFVAVLLQKAIFLIIVYFTEDLGWATTNHLRADLTAHVLRLDMGFHKLRTPGELIERIDSDVGELAEYFSEIITNLIGNGLLILGILVLVFLEDWRIGLVGLAYALLMVILFRLVQGRMVRLYALRSQANAERLGFLEERITGTEDYLPNGGADYVMNRLYPLLNNYAVLQARTGTLSTWLGAASMALFVLALGATMGLAAAAFLAGRMTIGTVFLLVTYIGLLESPLENVRQNLAYIQRALASANRTREYFELQPEVGEPATADRRALPDAPPAVVFEGVSFAYKDRRQTTDHRPQQESVDGPSSALATPTVIHDISFRLERGRVLGVLGRTGSGKTTLTRLLFRLYDVDAGAIRLDKTDIRETTLDDLRSHVGMVTQDVQLFAATVRDNLTLFAERPTDRAARAAADLRIIDALRTLGLGDWYRALPAGLDTVLESGGKGLSAGEAQLLAFTRVFLRDPRVVVLDEASSRLDPATEQVLERAIDRLLEGRTAIVIAHRLRTVGRADDILILEGGRVVEHGPRAELAADPDSRFYGLLQTGLEEVLV